MDIEVMKMRESETDTGKKGNRIKLEKGTFELRLFEGTSLYFSSFCVLSQRWQGTFDCSKIAKKQPEAKKRSSCLL